MTLKELLCLLRKKHIMIGLENQCFLCKAVGVEIKLLGHPGAVEFFCEDCLELPLRMGWKETSADEIICDLIINE